MNITIVASTWIRAVKVLVYHSERSEEFNNLQSRLEYRLCKSDKHSG